MADRHYHQNEAKNDHGANAPEAVDRLSPVTAGSNIERELQKRYQYQYQSTHEVVRLPLTPNDTEKEAVLVGHDSTGLHVVPTEHKAEYPEIATTRTPPLHSITNSGLAKPVLPEVKNTSLSADRVRDREINKEENSKILGISRKVFIPFAIVLVIIISAAIGGGVGGAIASRKSDNATSSAATNSSSFTVPSSTSSTLTSSTSSSASASASTTIQFLNNQTWPKGSTFAFQGFSRANFTGVASQIITGDGSKEFGADFTFDLHSYVWIPNINNCCINFCLNSTKGGKVGYHCGEIKKELASGPLPRINVWCSDTQNDDIAEEKGCTTPQLGL